MSPSYFTPRRGVHTGHLIWDYAERPNQAEGASLLELPGVLARIITMMESSTEAEGTGFDTSRQTREIVGFSTEVAQNPAHDKRESRQAVAFSKRAMQAAGGGNHHGDDVLDPELRKIVAAWSTLPEGMKRAMLAIVEAAK